MASSLLFTQLMDMEYCSDNSDAMYSIMDKR